MTSLLDDEDFAHTDVQVETLTGVGGRGDQFAPAVTRSVIVEDSRKQVRDSNGELTVSEARIFDHLDQANRHVVKSRITVRGRPARVISVRTHQLGDPDVDHLEIVLT